MTLMDKINTEDIEIKDNKELIDKYIEIADKYNKLLECVLDALQENNKNMDEMINSNNDILNTLDEASKSVIYNRATKKKGKDNPNYKVDIDTDTLIKDYIENNYRLTSEMCSKYNLTYQGIRLRLVERGIWKANKH